LNLARFEIGFQHGYKKQKALRIVSNYSLLWGRKHTKALRWKTSNAFHLEVIRLHKSIATPKALKKILSRCDSKQGSKGLQVQALGLVITRMRVAKEFDAKATGMVKQNL
jgi:hypothetical protein